MNRELRPLEFSAFQSHLWNLMLSGWICRQTRLEQRVLVDLKLGPLAFPVDLHPEHRRAIETLPLPLPSARTRRTRVLGGLIEVLEPFELEWNDLRVRHLKDVFLSKGTRTALVAPRNLHFEVIDDEIHAGRQALKMAFELGNGSYATILVKQIIDAAGPGQ